MSQQRKILFISYHFPPDSAVGAIRPAKFAKHLRRLGWRPYIVTIKEAYIPVKDHTRLHEVQDLPIVRTTVWPTVLQLAITLRKRLARSLRRGNAVHGSSLNSSLADTRVTGRSTTLCTRIKTHLNSIFELPDREIGWLIPAVWKAYWLIKRENIAVVITSSPPRTTALVGVFLSLVSDLTLITDLRDPWFLPVGKPADRRSWLGDRIETWLERLIMQRSAKIITTTEHYASFLKQFYSWLPADRCHNIWNGYDQEDFRVVPSVKPESRITFSYLGTFYFARTPKGFLKALSELIHAKRIPRHEIQVNFIGDVRYARGEPIADLLRSYDLVDCVTIEDPMPYAESLRKMMESDVLLLFAQDQYYGIPAKAFEYLAAQKRILCFSRDGATADLLRQTGAGVVVDPENDDQIQTALLKLFLESKKGQPPRHTCDISIYERRALSERLSRLLEESLRTTDDPFSRIPRVVRPRG